VLRLRTAVIVGFLALNLCACAALVFLPASLPRVTIDADHGYIYGRFVLTTPESSAFGPELAKIALIVAEKDTEAPHTVPFQSSLRVSVIAVDPGAFKLSKLVQMGSLRETLREESITGGNLMNAFSVEAGKAYYIGDIYAEGSRRSLFSKIDFSLTRVVDEYEQATAELKKSVPGFEKIPTTSVGYRFP
jgi:hypothetical protein